MKVKFLTEVGFRDGRATAGQIADITDDEMKLLKNFVIIIAEEKVIKTEKKVVTGGDK